MVVGISATSGTRYARAWRTPTPRIGPVTPSTRCSTPSFVSTWSPSSGKPRIAATRAACLASSNRNSASSFVLSPGSSREYFAVSAELRSLDRGGPVGLLRLFGVRQWLAALLLRHANSALPLALTSLPERPAGLARAWSWYLVATLSRTR
jgi:hypothetical protein